MDEQSGKIVLVSNVPDAPVAETEVVGQSGKSSVFGNWQQKTEQPTRPGWKLPGGNEQPFVMWRQGRNLDWYRDEGDKAPDDKYRSVRGPHENPNIRCSCGSEQFGVCWWSAPFTGGFCRIICAKCGNSIVLIDDYA